MLFVQMLLPRFLVLEGLVLIHSLGRAGGCLKQAERQVGDLVNEEEEEGGGGSRSSLAVSSSRSTSANVSQCGVNLADSPSKNLPLFLSSDDRLLFPVRRPGADDGDQWLAFPGRAARAVCPGAKLRPTGNPGDSLRCLGKSEFEVGGSTNVSFSELRCSRSIREKVVRSERACGPPEEAGKAVEVGWQVDDRFVTQISLCHDDDRAHTYYERHLVRGANIAALNDDPGRPTFKEGRGFYPEVSATSAYKLTTQERTLKLVLGQARGAEVFSKTKSFLARGHLAPDADFVWKEWQDATYYFANAAPQWQPFNNGNWKAVEAEVRHYAEQVGRDVEVFTGTLGHLAYLSDDGDKVKLFIGKRGRERLPTALPVPEFYWKLVHDPVAGGAVVFVGLNDPHFSGDPAVEAHVCPDVCEEGRWFFYHRKDVRKGYTYCCTYGEFRDAVNWIPELSDQPDLLKNILTVD